jgi:hypothetical protein
MLKSIETLSRYFDRELRYKIVDTCFIEEHTIKLKRGAPSSIGPDLAVIEVYSKRNRNVSKSLAQMYDYFAKRPGNINFYKAEGLYPYQQQLDKYYPEVCFGKKYFSSVLRYLEQMKGMGDSYVKENF